MEKGTDCQTPGRMIYKLHGRDNNGDLNGFTALGKYIGTSGSSEQDCVQEHMLRNMLFNVLKSLPEKLAHYLYHYRRLWFPCFGLLPPSGKHDQLHDSHVTCLMLLVKLLKHCGFKGVGRGRERLEIHWQVLLGIKTFWAISLSTAGGAGDTTSSCKWTLSSLFPHLNSLGGNSLNLSLPCMIAGMGDLYSCSISGGTQSHRHERRQW